MFLYYKNILHEGLFTFASRMGVEKAGTKSGGGHVGGFFQLFDWTSKSRKKLFASKSDVPESLKQGKKVDGNLAMTRPYVVMNEDEIGAGASVRGSDHSYASSVTDDEACGTRVPGVVARLMGLDALPPSGFPEPYSSPYFDTPSLQDAQCCRKNLNYQYDHAIYSGNLGEKVESSSRNFMEPKPRKTVSRPIEKFQTEVLPPKSAKSIPVTHHKLLSPIKSPGFVPSNNPAYIMEAAARIIEPRPQATVKPKTPSIASSSVSLKVRGLKEKVEASQKGPLFGLSTVKSRARDLKEKREVSQRTIRLSERSQKLVESNAAMYLKGQSLNKSWNGSTDSSIGSTDAGEDFSLQNKGKSISLAIQAKVNVQRREGLSLNGSRGLVGQKEHHELKPNPPLRTNVQKNLQKKSSVQGTNGVLRKTIKNRIVRLIRASYHQRHQFPMIGKFCRGAHPTDVIELLVVDLPGNPKLVQGSQAWVPQIVKMKFSIPVQIISLERKGPPTRTGMIGRCFEYSFRAETKELMYGADTPYNSSSKAWTSSSIASNSVDPISSPSLVNPLPRFQQKDQDVISTDTLCTRQYSDISPTSLPDVTSKHKSLVVDGMKEFRSNHMESQLFNCRHPSPISVLEPSFSTESCESLVSTSAINSTGESKLCSSVQAQEVFGPNTSRKFYHAEADTELSDSASSTSSGTILKKHTGTFSVMKFGRSSTWELDYVKEILCNVELMFMDHALGQAREIVSPHLFNQLESMKEGFENVGGESRINRKVMFDCVSECMDTACRRYACGGYKMWAKGVMKVRKNERLAEEVYKEISSWGAMGDSMVDELVDKDMSSQYGRWLNFDVDAFELGAEVVDQIFDSLVNDFVAEILQN
ncbi:uncharacterized protein LOC129308462 [Prosopis cineraria]|uniref:uncharacterized protein LOC129308462 n=1 Tax=Prosopis cineraria TaxID=364024 RepID=UPI00240EF3A4|nr:uncharacterized protein LOC129308462 [Prosopis cineraria]